MDTREKQDAARFLNRHVKASLDAGHPVRQAFEDAARTGFTAAKAGRAYALWSKLADAAQKAILNGWEWPSVRLQRCGQRGFMPALVVTQEWSDRKLRSAVIRYAMVESSPDILFSVPAGTPRDEVLASLAYLIDVVADDWNGLPGISRTSPDAVQLSRRDEGRPAQHVPPPPASLGDAPGVGAFKVAAA